MKTRELKYFGAKQEMQHAAEHCVKALYTRAIIKSWTTLGSTGKVRYETYQLALYLVMQIASDNHLGIEEWISYVDLTI